MKGSIIWNIQRYSSLLVLSYIFYVVIFVLRNELNFFSWSNFFLSFEIRFITTLVFLLIVTHAFIGLWTVGTDYLTNRTLGFLNKNLARRADFLRYVFFSAFCLLGFVYLTAIFYIIWL